MRLGSSSSVDIVESMAMTAEPDDVVTCRPPAVTERARFDGTVSSSRRQVHKGGVREASSPPSGAKYTATRGVKVTGTEKGTGNELSFLSTAALAVNAAFWRKGREGFLLRYQAGGSGCRKVLFFNR
ncbi:hypothetical protein MRX96_006567 [Rhipicephalus microplus]